MPENGPKPIGWPLFVKRKLRKVFELSLFFKMHLFAMQRHRETAPTHCIAPLMTTMAGAVPCHSWNLGTQCRCPPGVAGTTYWAITIPVCRTAGSRRKQWSQGWSSRTPMQDAGVGVLTTGLNASPGFYSYRSLSFRMGLTGSQTGCLRELASRSPDSLPNLLTQKQPGHRLSEQASATPSGAQNSHATSHPPSASEHSLHLATSAAGEATGVQSALPQAVRLCLPLPPSCGAALYAGDHG